MSTVDPRFQYTWPVGADVLSTWKKFGFKPMTDAERAARLKKQAELGAAYKPRGLPARARRKPESPDVPLRACERGTH